MSRPLRYPAQLKLGKNIASRIGAPAELVPLYRKQTKKHPGNRWRTNSPYINTCHTSDQSKHTRTYTFSNKPNAHVSNQCATKQTESNSDTKLSD